MIVQNQSCPWNVPIPVEPARFVSLFPEHKELNVRVSSNPVYGCRERQCPADTLLFADLQTSLHCHVVGRLGSGRAGFYRGWYLKGVGRTPLAANWNARDYLHNSGHMTASSAIREYVVSRYLASQGLSGSIVACEGVLLAELEPELRDYNQLLYAAAPTNSVPAVDHHVQAITVKRGGFARLSNFVWLLHHLTPSYVAAATSSLGTFCDLLGAALTPPGRPVLASAELTAERLASLFAASIRRACEYHRAWFEHGVWWGSFGNNSAIDGRFLDLETPMLFAGPCFGCLSNSDDDRAPERGTQSSLFGTEVFGFLERTRGFCIELRRILGNLPRSFAPAEREFAADLAREIERQVFAPDQLLGARALALEWVRGLVEAAFGRLPPEDEAVVCRQVERVYERELGDGPFDTPAVKIAPLFVAVPGHGRPVTEPGLRWRPFALSLASGRLLGPSEEQCRAGRLMAELISDLDHTTSVPALLERLADLARRDKIV